MRRTMQMALVSLLLSTMMISACAFDLAHVKYNPVSVTECVNDCREIQVSQEVQLNKLPCGYKRVIKKDTIWRQTGSIKEGQVFKPVKQSFTVECSNVYEAYLVMVGDQLNGFYLPVQDGFVALDQPVQITVN